MLCAGHIGSPINLLLDHFPANIRLSAMDVNDHAVHSVSDTLKRRRFLETFTRSRISSAFNSILRDDQIRGTVIKLALYLDKGKERTENRYASSKGEEYAEERDYFSGAGIPIRQNFGTPVSRTCAPSVARATRRTLR